MGRSGWWRRRASRAQLGRVGLQERDRAAPQHEVQDLVGALWSPPGCSRSDRSGPAMREAGQERRLGQVRVLRRLAEVALEGRLDAGSTRRRRGSGSGTTRGSGPWSSGVSAPGRNGISRSLRGMERSDRSASGM